jgi:hypothetical protein
MKIGEPYSISFLQQADMLTPEAMRAQRLAELANLAEFRARKLETVKLWSADPEAVYKKLGVKPNEDTAAMKAEKALMAESVMWQAPKLNVSEPYIKTAPREPWYKRIWGRLCKR